MLFVGATILLSLAAIIQFIYIERYLAPVDEDDDREWVKPKNMAINPSKPPQWADQRVSVIICANNEAGNLERNLRQVLNQDYCDADGNPRFEVIVVNDRSEDRTGALLETFAGRYPQLRVIAIDAAEPRTFPGKKFALSKGLAVAAYDIILMTDADCRPASSQWIKWMLFPFSTGKSIVAGYGGFEEAPGFLNKFIQCETIHTFAQFSGYCRRGQPYMAVGRNLACRKSLLLQAQNDPLWTKTASGDDDMLIRICANRDNMVVNEHPDSHTYSKAKNSWKAYLLQKQRHMSTGKYYAPRIKKLLAGYALSHTLFWISLVLLIIALMDRRNMSSWLWIWVQIGGILVIVRFISFIGSMNDRSILLAGNKRLKFFWPIFDISWMLYNIILSPYILWKSRQRWK